MPASTPEPSDETPPGPGPSLGLVIGLCFVLAGVVLVAVAFVRSSDGPSNATATSTSTPLRGFGVVAVSVTTEDGRICELCLLSATTSEQRERGLMEVTDEDLGGFDGMLFEYPEEVDGAFWMRNTPMPLSIAYFDDEGELVSTSDMQPCANSTDCPSYPADGAFKYAIEVPQGMLDEAGAEPGARLHIHTRRCPLVEAGS